MRVVGPGWRKHFAAWFHVDRTGYYRQPQTLRCRDQQATVELLAVHVAHPHYGVQRLAWELGWSQEKTRRIRTLAGVVIDRPTKRKRTGKKINPEIPAPKNALQPYAVFKNKDRPQDGQDYSGMVNTAAWVQDFTYLWFERSWCYMAVILDLKTRQIVGWRLGLSHSADLTYQALLDAVSRHHPPVILHSDQGSEYLSFRHHNLCDRLNITLSCSTKSSPWQNGYMERFFLTLKLELPPLASLHGLAELHEAVALAIHYYNTKRINTALQTTPANYAKQLVQTRDRVLQKTRG